MTAARRSALLVVLAGVLFGTAGTARAFGPADASATAIGILRIQVGAIALGALLPALGSPPSRLLALLRRPPIIVTAICAAVYQPLFFAAVAQAGVALGTLVTVGTQPMFAGLLGRLILGHRLRWGWVGATAIAVAGLALRSWDSLGVEGTSLSGLLLALGAGLASAGYTVAAKHQLDRDATALEVPAASFVLGGLLLLPMLAAEPLAWLATPSGLALALYLGVATMAVANVILARGIHGLPPGPVATLMLTDPVVATLLGVAVLAEPLSGVAAAGLLLVLLGLVLQGLVLARNRPADLEPAPVL